MNRFTFAGRPSPAELDALQARFALSVVARLNQAVEEVEPDVSERLRVAREQALERGRATRAAAAQPARGPALTPVGLGVLAFGGGPRGSRSPWWWKLASALPLAALVVGLLAIEEANNEAQIRAAAEIDAALLTDDLPPNAYADPGFGEFLKTASAH